MQKTSMRFIGRQTTLPLKKYINANVAMPGIHGDGVVHCYVKQCL
jgi:hypothetical protein